ncbi:DNA mismatch repair endonuclease MutL [Paenibacillus allorhizosphaerae]|uniref:DNA mismatch repair protein MutL n=1 Tax=Paenibacillus allorhizosphaerae TaxID=2849866 RepID=A0ABM8VLB7_9BACL|nr:DNA mismatch repair endonuclease MutL [Paenibacillus allorhizosphaerae]CAG7648417.1 DNA mismatch repair protein MutL [Paenibacillus allorhizosphaerae]
MGKINILDEHIANQIAAGEVVERPSSVVKELVENAVDAGSTRIDVTIEEGGLALIRVADNGSGMDPDDCETAFFRHATSKIASAHDLFAIRTLGFRGEALPSIAAVAKVECLTSPDTSGLGTKFVIEGGSVKAKADAAVPRGTDIAVRELFYNTPARLKYMKTIQTELGHVTDYMYRLALSHPGIAFTLKHNGNTLIQTLGSGDLLQVIAGVYGTAAARSMLPIRGESLDYRLSGYIGKPELTRANRNGISTVINGRYIRNFTVVNALLQGYHTLLPINRFPLAVLHLEMDPTLLDVNVHPAKLEVRFSKEPELMQLIEREVRSVLGAQRLIPSAGQTERRPREAVVQEQLELYRPQDPQAASPAGEAAAGREALYGEARSAYAAGDAAATSRRESSAEQPQAGADAQRGLPASPRQPQPEAWREPSPWRESASSPPQRQSPQESAQRRQDERTLRETAAASEALLRTLAPLPADAPPALPAFPKLHPIGQMHGTYIVAQNVEGLFLIDQHAAHERINYEHYFDMFGKPAQASQELLVPLTLEYTSIEAVKLAEKLPQLEQAGVFLEPFGGSSFLVRAYPHWLPKGEEQALVEEMIEWLLSEKKQVDIAKLREKAAIMCSCKASIKANQKIGTLEIETLLDRLAACRNPYTCPHGRPIVVSFSTYELEKMFKRVM